MPAPSFIQKEGRVQILLTEDFESGFPPAGWIMINAGSGNAWTEIQSCQCFIRHSFYEVYTRCCKANAWAISPTIAMSAGKTYEISFSYKGSSNNYMADTVKLTYRKCQYDRKRKPIHFIPRQYLT
jgi:hypothetical protein